MTTENIKPIHLNKMLETSLFERVDALLMDAAIITQDERELVMEILSDNIEELGGTLVEALECGE